MKKVCVVGLGHFGLALLKHFGRKYSNNQIELVGYSRGGLSTLETSIEGSDYIILAIASNAISEVVTKIRPHLKKIVVIVNTAKALDHVTGDPFSKITSDILSDKPHQYAVLAGATRAVDLAGGVPLGVHLACVDQSILKDFSKIIESKELSVVTTTDVLGVEYASAFKNVLAIFSGMLHGYGYTLETEIFAVTRMAAEVEKLVTTNFKTQPSTFSLSSPSWGNDVWMSCASNTRNRELGVLLGKGKSVVEVVVELEAQKKTVEGIFTSKILNKIAPIRRYPFLNFVSGFFEGTTPLHAVKSLLEHKLV